MSDDYELLKPALDREALRLKLRDAEIELEQAKRNLRKAELRVAEAHFELERHQRSNNVFDIHTGRKRRY